MSQKTASTVPVVFFLWLASVDINEIKAKVRLSDVKPEKDDSHNLHQWEFGTRT